MRILRLKVTHFSCEAGKLNLLVLHVKTTILSILQQHWPMDRTPIKIPGRRTRASSKAALAARKAPVKLLSQPI